MIKTFPLFSLLNNSYVNFKTANRKSSDGEHMPEIDPSFEKQFFKGFSDLKNRTKILTQLKIQ